MTNPQLTYAPRNPDFIDTIGYTQRVVDSILRNNPLTDAVVSEGLVRWLGNYTNSGNPDKINFLWIGEFLPADVNLPGSPPQRGFSLVRDDSRGGISAIALFDGNPGGGGGLRQTLTISSGDNRRLMSESRDGGWSWPQDNIWMGALDSDLSLWTGTDAAAFSTIHEGRVNVVGNRVFYRVFGATTGGATGDFRLRVEDGGAGIVGTTHTLGVNANSVFDDSVDVSALRGNTTTIRWEARRTNGVGKARSQVISMRCYTP